MSEPAEIKAIDIRELFDFFRVKALDRASGTSEYYLKAIRSLEGFLDSFDEPKAFPSEEVLVGWIMNLYLFQYSPKSILLYFNSISALYTQAVKEGLTQKTDVFGKLKPLIVDALKKATVTADDFHRLKMMIGSAEHLKGEPKIAADIILMSLLMGCKPIMEITSLKKSDVADDDKEVMAIVERNVNLRRKYIFNLRQHELTARQLEGMVQLMTGNLLSRYGVNLFGTLQETLESYWAYAALRTGVKGSEIVESLGHVPKGVALLSVSKPGNGDNARLDIASVGASFISNPLRWYAMRLRPYVTYDELVERINSIEDFIAPELFYPLDRIAKRIKKKLVFEQQPVISNIVFFHSRVTDIIPMFNNIGDIAWCYKNDRGAGGRYAAISDSSFYRFQETIGHYTADYEAQVGAQVQISEGTEVEVLGGLFAGMEASLEKVETVDGNSILQLMHLGDNNIRWSVGVDSRLVRPIHKSVS